MAKAQRKTVDAVPATEIEIDKVMDNVADKANKKVEVKLSEEQKKGLEEQKTVSAKIRYLNGEGLDRSAIAHVLNKRYQHVRNVLETPLKRPAAETK